jgi:arylsulfatase A-like enzyme
MNKFISGAISGAVAGLLYALLEYAVIIVRPMVQWRPTTLPPEHWQWEAAFLAVDAALGAILGGVVALVRRGPARPLGRRSATAAGGAAVAAAALVLITLWLNARPSLSAPHAGRAAAQGRPNVLLIVLDTVRADHLSVYGYERRTTPNLEKLAREGVLFRNAVSASDFTLTSHGSLFTGLYTSWHRAYPVSAADFGRLDASFHTLAEILAQNGYATFAVLANHGYLRPEFGMAQGFAYYEIRPTIRPMGPGSIPFLRNFARAALQQVTCTAELERLYPRADQITDGGLRVLNAARGGPGPFFLSLNYMEAHEPYSPPPPFRDAFPGRDPAVYRVDIGGLRKQLAAAHPAPGTAAMLRHTISQYDGSIAFMDAEIQRLFEGMKQAGLYDNTLIVVTSDHGQALGEHSHVGHPASLHQELVRVPLIVKYPARESAEAGQSVAATVSGVDVLPTILDTVGIPAPATIHGRSLRKYAPDADRIVISESFFNHRERRLGYRTERIERAFYRGGWKLIQAVAGKKELYHVDRDREELRNVYDPDSPIVRQLTQDLDHWIHDAPPRRKGGPKVDRETMDRLRSLGYVQ